MERNGKTLSFNFVITKIQPTSDGEVTVEDHYYLFQFPKRGEVTVIKNKRFLLATTSLL
ncbi:hypothetical protein DPMN_172903 [Dreissena polymorpha]|uniref:Uncharacterized protein n=1 Tax=Dreissena polymorpha TaxID=45954 RepID=A0A9D4E1V4_DREPO|nr:hypothetical protein DPMN_172903 [Dreissena polymorpha]